MAAGGSGVAAAWRGHGCDLGGVWGPAGPLGCTRGRPSGVQRQEVKAAGIESGWLGITGWLGLEGTSKPI